MNVPEIDSASAQELLKSASATFVDIRDPDSYTAGHVPGALLLSEQNANAFLSCSDKERPVVVYCFHGNSSKSATAHFLEKGFKDVKSLSGGFTGWEGESSTEEPAGEAPEGLSVSPLAKEKLSEYLKSEPGETRVRITLEGEGFGLSLDEAGSADLRFELEGLGFAIDRVVALTVGGLKIDFVEKINGAGFRLEGGNPPKAPGQADILEDVKSMIADNKIMLFMKGTADAPRCGFSSRTVEALRSLGRPFGHKNVLENPKYRYVLSEHSNWPTIPQIFVDGKFIGGCDIVMEMHANGDLKKTVEAAFAEAEASA